jgi:type I restriction enzyme S subunit
MKKGWEVKKLGEVCDFVRGPFGGSLKKDCFVSDGYAVYEQQHAIYDQFNDIRYFIEENKFNEMKRFELRSGDLIMSCSGTMGKVAIVPFGIKRGIINQALLKLTPKKNLNVDFLKYYMGSQPFQYEISKQSQGAAIQNVASVQILKTIIVPCPNIDEQRRIVTLLDETFAAFEQAKANLERNLQNAKELFQSELNSIFSQKGEGWVEKKLGDICETKPQKKEARDLLNDNDFVTFLPMEDLGIQIKEILPIKEKTLKEVSGSYTYFANGDVLLAKITPCFENGKIGIANNLKNGIGFVSSEYIVFRSKGEVEPELIYYFLSRKSFRLEGKLLMTGAVGHKRVSKDWIENYLLPFPKNSKDQQQIVQRLDALSAETSKLESKYKAKLDRLEELKKSMLAKAFSGEM